MEINNLNTGDILLFSGSLSFNPITWVDKFVEVFTGSPYSHIGMILKDPTWIDESMIGLYLWESNWEGTPDPQDGKIKLGVQVTPLEQILSERHQKIYVSQLYNSENKLTIPILEKIHNIVYSKPYDFNPVDWLAAYLRKDIIGPTKNTFFCSALVACIYTEAGILDKHTDWTIIRPSDFDKAYGKHLEWNGECHLEGLFELK